MCSGLSPPFCIWMNVISYTDHLPDLSLPLQRSALSSSSNAAFSAAAEDSDSAAGCEQEEEQWRAGVLERGAWPFQRLCDQLCLDVLDARWEVGATALCDPHSLPHPPPHPIPAPRRGNSVERWAPGL